MVLLIYILLGIIAGIIAASVNSFKDSPYENFELIKFFRSIMMGTLTALLYFYVIRKSITFDNLGILLLSMIPAERGMGELYKGFLTKQDHPEYVHGFKNLNISLKNYATKIGLMTVILIIYAAMIYIIVSLNIYLIGTSLPLYLKGAIIGAISALIIAIGGGIKDSQFEGWDWIKFFRSPGMGLITGIILINFTTQPFLLFLSNIGLERTMVECYKTFITRRVRGLHKGKEPSNPEWFGRRWIFFGSYLTCVIITLILLFS